MKRLSLLDMHKAIKTTIEESSDLKCVDGIGINEPSPFTFIDFTDTQPDDTKTMYVDKYVIYVHIISKAERNGSSVQHYKNIQQIEEAFTQDIKLPCEFNLIRQSFGGMVNNFTEETGEKHAVLEFNFWVSYGFKVKI